MPLIRFTALLLTAGVAYNHLVPISMAGAFFALYALIVAAVWSLHWRG